MDFLIRTNIVTLLMSATFWINLAIVFFVTLITYWLVKRLLAFVYKKIQSWNERQENDGYLRFILFDMLKKTSSPLIFFAAFLFSLRFVGLPERLFSAISHAWFLVVSIQMAIWLDQAIRSWMHHLLYAPGTNKNPVTLVILSIMLRALVWAMMFLSILANMGVDITALVASLGVGGIAIALAVQTVLSDIFASLSIGIDKPFEIGDFVVFNDVAGTIEHIGLKTTRIRSLSGEQIVCANANLLQQTIHNYKRMQTRRIVFTFGVATTTEPEKLRLIGPMVKDVIVEVGETKFDRAHLLAFNQDRLTFEVVHIVNSADYNKYMDIQQEINIRIIEQLKENDIELALPSLVVRSPLKVEGTTDPFQRKEALHEV
ncbi:Small-conductance mechanosensitive channel [Enterobacter sp. kpr-6]|uniref:mechanosensitive ion channel family protein n=1 Tax=Enterobacter sp. kpr-6 TaxID=1761782 RepID=UPI0008E9D525|nr:mechanosensitive ion channel family protein [Enterobacter sp. kpr-6]SFR06393.1 Small-conductance mechanosensitive channel [Enterobacter sp. kpr-6]